MSSTHAAVIEQLIDRVRPIVTMERDGLVVIALGTGSDGSGPAYLTLDEAAGTGAVDVHELGGGSVPAVAVETKDSPVVIFGGDTIVGGKQNRIVNVTIWLTADEDHAHPRHLPRARSLGPGGGGALRLRSQGRPAPALDARHAGPRPGSGHGRRWGRPRPHPSATWPTRARSGKRSP